MKTARLFTNGRSQAVRLPADCRFAGKDVYVHKLEGAVLLVSVDDPWGALVKSLKNFTPDFMESRIQPKPRKRKALL